MGGSTATVRVRRSINSLAPTGREIASFRRGVAEMKRRSNANPADPTGWTFQANIHGTYDTPARPEWNQCQHGSFFFLSWHRMYVYFFERILRAASGDPTFALPYWNYSDPAQRALHLVLRSPARSSNSLYTARRAQGVNQGFQLAPSDVTFTAAFGFLNFTANPGSGLSFGGQRAPGPGHFLAPHGQLESQPHDIVHDKLGGPTGLMSDPNTAARDPVFWLHHANIDRLWKRWLDRGGGRADPTDATWLGFRFTFSDENGRAVRMSGRDVLDTGAQLNYRYDDDPPPVPVVRFAEEPHPEAVAAAAAARRSGVVVGASRTPRPVEHAAPEGAPPGEAGVIELGAQPVTVPVEMPQQANRELAEAATADTVQNRIVLNLEGIDFERNPGVSYEVYVGLPEGHPPDFQSLYYVGNLGFFGLKPHQHGGHGAHEGEPAAEEGPSAVPKRSFDITANVRALQARGEWQGQPVRVTMVMRGLDPPAETERRPTERRGRERAAPPGAQPAQPGSRVTIDRVTITTE